MSTVECLVDGCARSDIQGHGWCQMHYYRWRRTGSTGTADRLQRAALGVCSVEDCENRDKGPHGLCAMHKTRLDRHGGVEVKLSTGRPAGPTHHSWSPDESVTYTTVHHRLARVRGKARTHACLCGQPAAQWSYNHTDPNQMTSPEGPYSADLNHYTARCVPCHKRFDLEVLAGAA